MPVPNKKVFPNASLLWLMWTQFFPPKAPLTEANIPKLSGRVFIVTGGNSGVGEQLTRILYQSGGTVFVMTRDEAKTMRVIDTIVSSKPKRTAAAATPPPGKITFIHLDLADLSTVAPAVKSFLASNPSGRLDVLFNNAGVGGMSSDQRTAQGLEPHFGINAVGPFLLTKLLFPVLAATAKRAGIARDSVRVVWTTSLMVDLLAPEGGVDLAQLDVWTADRNEHYAASKAAAWFLAYEFHRRQEEGSGVVSVAMNPGTLRTGAWRYAWFYEYPLWYPLFSRAVDGAHTNLWCGLSKEVCMTDGGKYAMPWGRWHPGQRVDIVAGLKQVREGGTGQAAELWKWCEKTVGGFER